MLVVYRRVEERDTEVLGYRTLIQVSVTIPPRVIIIGSDSLPVDTEAVTGDRCLTVSGVDAYEITVTEILGYCLQLSVGYGDVIVQDNALILV